MDKVTIGTILKKRIKEMGYTQTAFAEEVGIGISSLRKYMKGTVAYNYEVMELFANKLNCSFDYLLGISKSPNREYHNIIEQTHLTEEAVSQIVKYAKHYDDQFEARRYIKTLDLILCEHNVFNSICDLFVASRPMDTKMKKLVKMFQKFIYNNAVIKEMGIEEDKILSLETQQIIYIVSELLKLKSKISDEFIDEIKKLEPAEDIDKRNEFLQELLGCDETQNAYSNAIMLLQKYGYIGE